MKPLVRRIKSDIELAKYRVQMAETELENDKQRDNGQDLFNLNAFGRGYRTASLNAEKERLTLLEDYLKIIERCEQDGSLPITLRTS